MNIRLRVILALIIMFAVALASTIAAVIISRTQEKIITQHNIDQHRATSMAVVKLEESTVKQIVYDYTYWDDFVINVSNPNQKWSNENISSILSSFKMDGVWMVNLEGAIVFSDFSEDQKKLNSITFDSSLLSKLYKDNFIDYYCTASNEVVFISGATIHPTTDPQRETEPKGYFFIAKVWDMPLFDELKKISGKNVSILERGIDQQVVTLDDEIITSIPFLGWKNDSIAAVVFSQKFPYMGLYRTTSNQMLTLFVATALGILVVVAFLLSHWVTRPLRTVEEIVSTQNTEKIKLLRKSSIEFQRIGQLVEKFIAQQHELKTAKEHAEAADQLKTAFLANMSHEIRTPLFGILGFTELLKDAELTEEARLNHIEVILNSGQHLLSIINDIIDLSKIEAGFMELTEEVFNLDELMVELHQFFTNNRFVKDRGLTLKLSTELRDESYSIKSDRKRVKQVLTNLLSNAIKFTLQGEVEFGYKQLNDQETLFFVRDTGIGISKELHGRVFERFIQVDNSIISRQFEGTGLGLSITKALVEHIGGKIWVESELDRGSLFSFVLPLPIIIGEKVNIQPIDYSSSIGGSLKGKRILVVDDFEHNCKLFRTILEKTGAETFQAASGEQTLAMVKSEDKFDIILLDLCLKGIDGFTTAMQLREAGVDSIIIAHTAFAMDSNREKSLSAGCNDFFVKPIGEKELVRFFERHV
jgi:signal transduction histidine kinase